MADLSSIKEQYSHVDDAIAREEEEKEFKQKAKHNRREHIVEHYGRLIFKIAILALVVALIFCRIICLILPQEYKWLSKEALSEIDKFLVEGGIGAVVFSAFKSIILGKKNIDFG